MAIYDVDWGKRMDLLVELMQLEPHKPMKKLQREALKYYPLYRDECIRAWMSWHVACKAADRLNKKEGIYNE